MNELQPSHSGYLNHLAAVVSAGHADARGGPAVPCARGECGAAGHVVGGLIGLRR
ncbi:hypothetical protein ACFV1N_33960 [Streptosporangium canum]|uniref:hypothetical protein n=1 Tax=Streptosporangium canum TaxID=324952 RepID=UPI0036946875